MRTTPGSLSLTLLAASAALAQPQPADVAAFAARHGAAWRLEADASSGRPRRLIGGAIPLDASTGVEAAALSFLTENADLLGVDASTLRLPAEASVVTTLGPRLLVLHFEVAPHGVPVVGGRVTVVVSAGRLTAVHLVGTAPVAASRQAHVSAASALEAALVAARVRESKLDDLDAPRLVFLPEGDSHRLAWEVVLMERDRPRRLRARVDAATGVVISVTDQTVSACLPAANPSRRARGGVRPERADEPEREELLPHVTAGGVTAGRDGVFTAPAPLYDATLTGPGGNVDCVGCASPAQPLAPAAPNGDVDFGDGGADELGNGLATPACRAAFFHAEAARRHASRWLSIPFTRAPVRIRTNIDSACNATWDGRGINFFRSGGGCANTGEIRDVVAHEWGHGLDQNDGLVPPGLEVDGATGEAVADIVAMLRSRDACVGESFYQGGGGPSSGCSGVRDLDERAPGHGLGDPATLSTENAADLCPPSAFYRGPLGREGHCEGQIFGQAFWHLVQDLVTGASYADGAPLPTEPLAEDQAWDLAERLFYASRAMTASYAPSRLQSIGMSAHDAFLLADDEGDGLANGTPHAAAIHDAFAHHGMEESPVAPPDAPDCAPPADPAVDVAAQGDPASGLPALVVSWSDVGATRTHVLRADDLDDAHVLLETRGPGAGALVDRGVLPGRTYSYRVVAEDASGCLSPGASPTTATPGAMLVLTAARISDLPPGGDGDGRLAEPETADVFIDLANDGMASARNLRVSLSASDPRLQVLGPTEIAYGTIPPGGRASAPAPFSVRVAGGVPRHVFLVATAESDDGCLSDAIVVEVAARDVRLDTFRIDDPPLGGDGDLSWRSGERVSLVMDLENHGLLDADPVDAVLTFAGPPVPGITIVDGTAAWGLVAAGAGQVTSAAPHFVLDAMPGLPPRTRVPLQLAIRIGGTAHASYPLTLTVGAFPAPTRQWGKDFELWSTPLVLPLGDTDGDGVVTACDVPAIVALGEDPSRGEGVFAFRGDTGEDLWHVVSADDCADDTITCTVPQSALAGGDIDGDGDNEVVVVSSYREVTAISSEGGILWTTGGVAGSNAAQVWDVDADGTVEVVVGCSILDGATGAEEVRCPDNSQGRILVADLDLDGRQEIVAGWLDGATYRADGSAYPAAFPGYDEFGGVVNLDDEPHPEVVTVHDNSVTARHADGTLAWERTDLPWRIAPSPPCFGDLDGDGRAEVALATEDEMWALDDDGSDLWRAPMDDRSGMFASCSVFDFDGDGLPEVVYRDSADVAIFDGRDGEVLWRVPASSSTLWETPVVADVDADGSAEIVLSYTRVGTWSDPQTLHVFGSPLWLPARAVWNQEAYSITNVEDDGDVPRLPTPSWLAGNGFKAQSGNGPCACAEPAASFTVTRPDCGGTTACFVASATGVAVADMSWDFGDGSPGVTGDAPCHEYALPGEYPVRLTVGTAAGCPREVGRIVVVRTDLLVGLTAVVPCLGEPTCVSTLATGGAPPYELAWDFGDGSPQVTGVGACHDYAAGGNFVVTHFVRDSEGCLAESSEVVSVVDPANLPDVSPRGTTRPLRVRRVPGALELTYEATGFDAGVYEGDVQALRRTGYTHATAGACRIAGDTATVAFPPRDAYYLVVTSACDPLRREGSYGSDSFRRARPSAADLGLPSCP
jgi:outer membrane protein assembly factor BamB/Zn-dependent metalloprotease